MASVRWPCLLFTGPGIARRQLHRRINSGDRGFVGRSDKLSPEVLNSDVDSKERLIIGIPCHEVTLIWNSGIYFSLPDSSIFWQTIQQMMCSFSLLLLRFEQGLTNQTSVEAMPDIKWLMVL